MNRRLEIFIKCLIVGQWSLLSLISLNHLYPFWKALVFPTTFLGVLALITIGMTIAFLAKRYVKQSILMFLIFFGLGYYIGPFLEPPADPLHHLSRTYSEVCEKNSNQITRVGRGLWSYSALSLFVCESGPGVSPRTKLAKIDLFHGIIWGLMMTGLFILAKSASLPDRWAFLSSLIAFLFLGTNRFSYFSYYTLAPSSLSLLIYWLWTASFFFRRNWTAILLGTVMAALCLPVLWVNHMQEAAFLGFIALIWVFWNLNERIWPWLNRKAKPAELLEAGQPKGLYQKLTFWKYRKYDRVVLIGIYLSTLFVLLFAAPQFESFRTILSPWSARNLWKANHELIFYWQGFHIMPKLSAHRVLDTLGLMSMLPVLLSVAFLWPGLIRTDGNMKVRVLILGMVPILGYAIPFFNFIWGSNAHWAEYYRLCYASMFWIPICFFLYGLEGRFSVWWKNSGAFRSIKALGLDKFRSPRAFYFTGCLLIIMLLSGIRSGPVYGKLDFLLLETRPWWEGWKPLIEEVVKEDRKTIYTDPQTSFVLGGIFNLPTEYFACSQTPHIPVLNVNNMEASKEQDKYRFIVNLRGFIPSWVPGETRHWSHDFATTSLFYTYNGLRGEGLKKLLRDEPLKNCWVYF